MRIEQVKVTKENAMQVLVSNEFYLIKKSNWDDDKLVMTKVQTCEVSEILDEKNAIIRVVTEDYLKTES